MRFFVCFTLKDNNSAQPLPFAFMQQRQRILVNVSSNYVLLFVKLLLGFIAVPLYLDRFGATIYGVFIITIELPNLLTAFDIGTSKSVLRYCAEYRIDSEKNLKKQYYSDLISANITLSVLLSFLVFFIILVIAYFSPEIYDVDSSLVDMMQKMFIISSFSGVFVFLGTIPYSVLSGFALFATRNWIQYITFAYQALLIISLYFNKINVLTFAIYYSLIPMLSLILDILLVKKLKLLDTLNIRIVGWREIRKKGNLKYNIQLFGLTAIALFSSMMDKQLIAIIAGPASVALYVVLTKLYFILKSFMSNINNVIRPELTKFSKNGSLANSTFVYLYIHFFSILLFLVAILSWMLWPKISLFWLGTNAYANEGFWVFLAVVNIGLSVFNSIFISYLTITGNTSVLIKTEIVSVGANVLLSIYAIHNLGAVGAILGTTLQMVINAIVILNIAGKCALLKLEDLLKSEFLLQMLFIVLIACLFYFGRNENLLVLSYVLLAAVILKFGLFNLKRIKALI